MRQAAEPAWSGGATARIAAPAAPSTLTLPISIEQPPGAWGERMGWSAGSIVLIAAVLPADLAPWAGVTLTATLETSLGSLEGLPGAWRVEDTQTGLAAGLLLRATVPPMPQMLVRVRASYAPALAADDELVVIVKSGAIAQPVYQVPTR